MKEVRKIIREVLLKEIFGETWDKAHDVAEKMGGHEELFDAFIRYFEDSKVNEVLDTIVKDYELSPSEDEAGEDYEDEAKIEPIQQVDKLGDLGQFSLNEDREQRYVAKIDFYVYAKSDEEALSKSKSIANEMEMRTANDAKVVELGKQSFGSLEYIPLSIK